MTDAPNRKNWDNWSDDHGRPIFVAGDRERPGFHDLNLPEVCTSPEHSIPTHLHIPGGQKYVHYCPACGHKSVAYGVMVRF